MNRKTLVLNSAYEPIRITTAQEAFVRVWKGRAMMVEAYEDEFFHSAHDKFPVPSIIRTIRYYRSEYRRVPLTKRNIYIRDSYTCAYTGKRITDPRELSIDHIIPRSKGGPHTWDNVVTSLKKPNEEKGDYILGVDPEVDHLPIPKVGRPHYLVILQNGVKNMPESWKQYLYLK